MGPINRRKGERQSRLVISEWTYESMNAIGGTGPWGGQLEWVGLVSCRVEW